MKKLIVISVVTLVFVGIANLPVALAADGDVVITLVIPAAKVADFRAGFLAMCPNNETMEDVDDPTIMVPKYTDKQWFKEWIRRDVLRAYRHGKAKLARDTVVSDPNVIQ